jgi:hypothetical protein
MTTPLSIMVQTVETVEITQSHNSRPLGKCMLRWCRPLFFHLISVMHRCNSKQARPGVQSTSAAEQKQSARGAAQVS